MYRIMLVDDEINVLRALRRALAPDGYELEAYSDPREALQRLRAADFALVLSDYRMPGMDGVALLARVKDLQPDAVRLILSGQADLQALQGAINEAEIYRFINKPWEDYELRVTIDKALAHRALLLENRRLADQVRAQQDRIARQRRELERLERLHPGITRVNWGPDGSVILDEKDFT